MDKSAFRKQAHELIDWMADYIEDVEQYPVKSQVNPGDIIKQLPNAPPTESEEFSKVFEDFKNIIIPGMTHWQHPSFFAYFPASRGEPSILAEMITATLGAQCMMWATSPAAAELEEQMMEWLKQMMHLPNYWNGCIHDTASTATFCALLEARERSTKFESNRAGLSSNKYRIYCSGQTHSSIEKGAMMAGFGLDNVLKIPVDEAFAMKPNALQDAIEQDLKNGFIPSAIVGAIGTTGSTAIDPINEIGEIAKKYGLWFHIDAAFAGSAFVLEDFRNQFGTLETADSFVFNPHKWMLTNFDCTVYYVRDVDHLLKTFTAAPEYLRTQQDEVVNNYKDWGVQLGRRFRALKLWFVLRMYGVDGIRNSIRGHIELGRWFANQVSSTENFELMAPVPLNTVCFRFNPGGLPLSELNALNEQLMNKLNDSGKLYLTHTKLDKNLVLRFVPSQSDVKMKHVEAAWTQIKEVASLL